MNKRSYSLGNLTFVLGIFAVLGIIYNMLTVRIFKVEIFFDHVVSSAFEFAILIATLFILLFDIAALGWVSHRMYATKKTAGSDTLALILGVVCLFALMGAKVMADEISREYRLGWETLGEWIILYACFFVQFFYSVFIFALLRKSPP